MPDGDSCERIGGKLDTLTESGFPAPARREAGAQNIRFIITIMTTRNSTVMMPPARMKSGTR